ncbi:hypothetical protein FYK55_27770 [Roseiconus nitratireducens]|uniref:Uncharacterized protein n=1 Tax=Roseiconus nitratireducens TaxID=2605748 RepID=A0A5M6CXN9_9BACT|nr:hypothetical protein [Roseiconus nitratireducens]KAA5538019.1 hypothetical protein FYK55_27770 [Roseiconus nitratireducens]
MAFSTDINLPRRHHARYPARCVRCGGDHQGRKMRLWTHTIGWWTAVFWIFGWGFTTRAPACKKCARLIRAQRVGGLLLTLLVAGMFMTFVWPHVDDFVAHALRKWVALGLILICLTPYIFWEIVFPPAIDITAYKNSVDYEFRDPEYAFEFADLNADADWVRIS